MDNNNNSSNKVNESSLAEIIEILYSTMKDTNDSLDLISSRTLCNMCETTASLVLSLGTKSLSSLLSEIPTNESDIQTNYDNILNIVELFKEIFTKHKDKITTNDFKGISSFLITNINKIKDTSHEKINVFKNQLTQVMKIYIYLSNTFYNDVLIDMLTLFPPGSVPDRLVIESLIDIAKEHPMKTASNFHDVISRSLPLLGSISHDKPRVNFANLFSTVSEAMIFALENEDPNAQRALEALSHLFATAYEMISAKWVNGIGNENKVYIVQCVMMISSLLPENTLGNVIDDICSLFNANIIKGENHNNTIIAKSFRIFLETNISKFKNRILINVDRLLNTLNHILSDINVSPNVIRYDEGFIGVKSELFKIYNILFKEYTDKVFDYLVGKFEAVEFMDKIAGGVIMKTMMIRAENISKGKIETLISAISKAIHENDYELKHVLIDLIYILFEKEYVNENTSTGLISFLVKESGYSDDDIANKIEDKDYPFYTNLKAVRDKAEMVLIDIVRKMPKAIDCFYPRIFELLCSEENEGSCYIICELINKIFENVQDKKSLILDFEKYTYLPLPEKIIVRLMIFLSEPFKRAKLPNVIFKTFTNVISILPQFPQKVDATEPQSYLSSCKYFSYSKYFDTLLPLWDRVSSLPHAGINPLLTQITKIISSPSPKKIPSHLSSLLMQMIGVLLSKITQRDTIRYELDNIFFLIHPEYKKEKVDGEAEPSSPTQTERLGCAEAFGFAARENMEIVIDKVNAIFKSEVVVKPVTGFASFFMSSKTPELSNEMIASLITILGSIAKHAKPSELKARINTNFISHLDSYFNNESKCKNSKLKLALMNSYGKLFNVLSKLSSAYIIDNNEIFYLQKRDVYLSSMVKIFKSEKKVNEIKISSLNNVAYLIKLDPPISLENCKNYIDLAFSVFDYDFENITEDLQSSFLDAACNVLESVLSHETYSVLVAEGQVSVSKKESDDDKESYSKYIPILNYEKDTMTQWELFSFILEKFVERYTRKTTPENEEKNERVKLFICDKVNTFINSKKSVKFSQDKIEFECWVAGVISLLHFGFDENNNDSQSAFISISRLLTGIDSYDIDYANNETFIIAFSKILKEKLKKEVYLFFTKMAFNAVKSQIPSVSQNASMLITQLCLSSSDYISAPENSDKLDDIIDALIKSLDFVLSYIKDEPKTNQTIKSILTISDAISKINLDAITKAALNEKYGVSFPMSLSLIVSRFCDDKSTISKIFTKITDIINNGDPGVNEKPNFAVCRSTVILGTMLNTQTNTITPLIKKFLPQLLCTLLLRIGSVHSINYIVDNFKCNEEDPRNQAVWALQRLAGYFDQEEISSCLGSDGSIAKKLLSSNEYDEGVYELMTIFCKVIGYEKQQAMFDFLSGFIERQWGGQRVVVATCYAMFVTRATKLYIRDTEVDVDEWRGNLLSELEKMMMDSDECARKMAIRGIGNLCQAYSSIIVDIDTIITMNSDSSTIDIDDELREKTKNEIKAEMLDDAYDASVVNLLIEKLSDQCENVVLESLNSLRQMMEFISMKVLDACIANMLIKIRASFDNAGFQVRSIGFCVFNTIMSICDDEKESRICEVIKEHIHLNLVSLLLHSSDEILNVRNMAFKALNKAMMIIANTEYAKEKDKLKEKYNDDNERIYSELMEMICEKIAICYPDKVNFHIDNCIAHSLSTQIDIRANSVFLIGVFYQSLEKNNKEIYATVDVERILGDFAKLLKDFDSKVKIKTMKAIKYFKNLTLIK